MKKINLLGKYLLAFFLVGWLLPACTDLDEEVFSELDGTKFFDNPDNLVAAFGRAYTNLYDLVGHKYGFIGSEVGTDMLIVPQRGGDWFDGGEWVRFHRQTWQPLENYFNHWWSNCFRGVNLCNQLIFQFEQVETESAALAIAELRAFRALYYYWLIDKFGNVPIVTEFDVPADFKPTTSSRAEVFNFIEQELLEVRDLLSKEVGLTTYGRVNYYVAQMVLAKLYLNAEVFIGQAKYNEAQEVLNTISSSNEYALESDYFRNFSADASTSSEVLFAVPYDQVNATGFEIHLFTLHYNLQEKFGLEDATWNGICAQEAFYDSFEDTDLRRAGLLAGPQSDAEGNIIRDPSFEKFDPTNPAGPRDPDGAPLNLTPEVNMLEPSCLRQAGARVAKFSFIPGSDRYTSNDYPVFRYSDVLLMQAEVALRLGNAGAALDLVNEVRARAGVDPLAALTLDDLLAERGRELYAEGHRRTDMIRFGTLADARWEKEATDLECVKLWAIPQIQIDANPNLQQNPCY